MTFIGWCLAWLVVTWMMVDPAPPTLAIVSDKAIHFASFVAVSFAALAFCRSGRQLAAAGVFCALAGVGFELVHYAMPARAFELGDIAANVGGAVTGILLAALSLGFLQRLARPSRRRRAAGRTA